MKTVQLLIIYISFISSGLNAQSTYFNIKERQKFKDKNSATIVKAIYTTAKNETVIARLARKKLIFEIYNNNVKQVFTYKV